MSEFSKDAAGENGGDESHATLSLMGGVVRTEGLPEADAEFGGSSGAGRGLGQGTMLLLLIAAVAAGSIGLMRVSQRDLTSGAQIQEAEARVEQALAKLTSPASMAADDPLRRENLDHTFQNTDAIVAMFSTDTTQRQVPIDQLQKDPFALTPTTQPAAVRNVDAEEARRQALQRQREQQLRTEFSRLQLQSVMQGRVPVAIINGEFVRAGQTLGSFTVRSIDAMTVQLEADGQISTLSLQGESRR